MASFSVGQRVRCVGATFHHDLIGTEGTIDAPLQTWLTQIGLVNGYSVAWDKAGKSLVAYAHELEPIQPERNRIVAWESLPIDPRKVLEGVS